jgi:hypothetical protein
MAAMLSALGCSALGICSAVLLGHENDAADDFAGLQV